MKKNTRLKLLGWILTIVIIVGILAAIAIPQFSFFPSRGLHSYGGGSPSYAPAASRARASHSIEAPSISSTAKGAEFNTEEHGHIEENRFLDVLATPRSTFSVDVDTASYSIIRRMLRDGRWPVPKDAVRIEELVNYFTYDYPEPNSEEPVAIIQELSACPWNSEHQLLHIGLKAKSIELEKLPANNLVFLLDVSGSMNNWDKLPLLQKALTLLTLQLRPEDRVAIVVYAGAAGVVLEPTSGSESEKILTALNALEAGGSTAGGEGIALAYELARNNFTPSGNNRVILATDGDFNVGVSSEGELVKLIEGQRESGIALTVLGFGTGNLKDSKMEQLANHGNGNYAYIDSLLEARKVLVKEMGSTLLTLAQDVKIQVEFNPHQVKSYRLIGYENRLLATEDFKDDTKDAGEMGAGHTVTALYEIIPRDEETATGDTLRYQDTKLNETAKSSSEAAYVKFRYKRPGENESQLFTHAVPGTPLDASATSANFRFSAAVAEWGLLLRNSEFKGNANYRGLLQRISSAKGKDKHGYRGEFLRLVELSEQADTLERNKQL